jgi:hypothetical protein
MDHPPRKDYAEMSKFNFTGPYEPYRDQHVPQLQHGRTESTDRLVRPGYHLDDRHDRSLSRESHRSRDSNGSPERHHPTTPGYGLAY